MDLLPTYNFRKSHSIFGKLYFYLGRILRIMVKAGGKKMKKIIFLLGFLVLASLGVTTKAFALHGCYSSTSHNYGRFSPPVSYYSSNYRPYSFASRNYYSFPRQPKFFRHPSRHNYRPYFRNSCNY